VKMNTWSELRMEYKEPVPPVSTGPLERLWQSSGRETVFLSAAELGRREDEVRNEAVVETEGRLQHDYDAALLAARHELIQSLAVFQADRAAYFHDMQREVVRLALAIGRTVIERELETNPTLLEEAARDVLQRVESGSLIRLRVPAADISAWQASMAMEIDRGMKIEVIGEEGSVAGQCTVETVLGTTEFDIGERLHEVEAALIQCTDSNELSRSRPVIVQ
jgi:flagellar biosynthesis/type III secretory pathway protein FliH